MTTLAKFDACFEQAFNEGMSDIKFFVRPSKEMNAESLMLEILSFQQAIKDEKFTRIASVD